MKVLLAAIGQTDKKYMQEGIDDYVKRINFYLPFELKIIPDLKNRGGLSPEQQKEREGPTILNLIEPGDVVVVLDEHGTMFSSVEFASWMQKRMISGVKRVLFIIGGPYGFSEAVLKRADFKISLSSLTFSHQMVRMIFVEQCYRAMTILRNEPYHHE